MIKKKKDAELDVDKESINEPVEENDFVYQDGGDIETDSPI